MAVTAANEFVPTTKDMQRMIAAFVNVHVDNELDGIGPNKPDAPFFKAMANADEINEAQYLEMADRLHKYRKTQLPLIQHLAGYPADTDWDAALEALRVKGKIAVDREHAYNLFRWSHEGEGAGQGWSWDVPDQEAFDTLVDTLSQLGYSKQQALAKAKAFWDEYVLVLNEVEEKLTMVKTVDVEEYDEVWYSKNDYSKRYPRKSKRLILDWKSRNVALYQDMKDALPFPSFKWNGVHMSVSMDAQVIRKAITILKQHKYITTKVEEFVNNMSASDPVSNSSAHSVTLKGDTVVLRVPYDDTTSRFAIKNLSSRKWLPDDKAWSIPMSEASTLINKLGEEHALSKALNANDTVSNYIKTKAQRIAISSAADLNDNSIVTEMEERLAHRFPKGKTLYPFQYVGVRFAELAGGKCLIGDDMGIGKTIQALAYAALHEEQWPVLVVCPSNVKYNWAKEIQAWLPSASLQIVKSGKQVLDDYDFTVINYDLMGKQLDNLKELQHDIIIFDESHYLKNKKAKRTLACIDVAEDVSSILALSGTAITNRPIELFTTLELVSPAEYKDNYFHYAKRYCDGHKNQWGYWDDKGASNTAELHERLRDTMIRRLKKEVMAELPDKVRQFIPVVPSDREMSEYKATHRQWIAEYHAYKEMGGMPAGFVLNMLTDLRHKAGQLKIDSAANWIHEYKEQNENKPIVVFFHHRDVGEGLLDLMEDDKRFNHKRWRMIYGGVTAERRDQYITAFQEGKLDGLLCSTTAANMGITLTAADTVVFIEREWVPAYEEQAEDRVNRIGQDSETVWATYLSVVSTIDEKFDRIVEEKREVTSAVLDGTTNDETRDGIAKALLQAMVEAGDLPEEMLDDIGIAKPKTHAPKDEDE